MGLRFLTYATAEWTCCYEIFGAGDSNAQFHPKPKTAILDKNPSFFKLNMQTSRLDSSLLVRTNCYLSHNPSFCWDILAFGFLNPYFLTMHQISLCAWRQKDLSLICKCSHQGSPLSMESCSHKNPCCQRLLVQD